MKGLKLASRGITCSEWSGGGQRRKERVGWSEMKDEEK